MNKDKEAVMVDDGTVDDGMMDDGCCGFHLYTCHFEKPTMDQPQPCKLMTLYFAAKLTFQALLVRTHYSTHSLFYLLPFSHVVSQQHHQICSICQEFYHPSILHLLMVSSVQSLNYYIRFHCSITNK